MIVVASGVEKSFGGLRVLRGVSLRLGEGERVGILGPSGCGKTTLLRILLGLERHDRGSIESGLSRAGYLPQDSVLFPWKTLIENVALPLQIRGVRGDERRVAVRSRLGQFGLDGFERAYPHELSGGMRQRAALLRAVLAGADALVLDEPFGALDTLTRLELQEWMAALVQELGQALLFVTHDLDEAIILSERLVILSRRPAAVVAEEAVDLRAADRAERFTGRFAELRSRLTARILEGAHDDR
jgi:ABC-type nitrate/sulfonate/bicarbonate transport system ATPase subunit